MTKRFKVSPVPEGHAARGASGKAANVGATALAAVRAEGARQRRVWNHFLALNKDHYAAFGTFIFYAEMAALLTDLRRTDPWIGAGGCAAQQATLRALDKALRDSFPSAKARKGFPRFKKARDHADSVTVPAACLRTVRDGDCVVTHVRLPNLPPLRVRGLKVPKGTRLTKATLRVGPDEIGVSIGYVAPLPAAPAPTEGPVGIDGGFRRLLALSTGETVENPRFLKKAQKRLRRAQRTAARRRKGSVNRRRATREVARRHRRVADLRRSHHHRLSRRIVDAHSEVSVETLGLSAMAKGRHGASVGEAGLGELLRQVRYKAEWAGRPVRTVGRFERSTGCCPDCSLVGPRLDPNVRTWTCAGCGEAHDRDVAAARWICMVGRRSPEPAGASAPRPKRGIAGSGKRAARAVPRPPGPPSNVLSQTHPALASTG